MIATNCCDVMAFDSTADVMLCVAMHVVWFCLACVHLDFLFIFCVALADAESPSTSTEASSSGTSGRRTGSSCAKTASHWR